MSWVVPYLGTELLFRHPERFWYLLVLLGVWLFFWLDHKRRAKALENLWIRLHLSSSNFPVLKQRVFWWLGFSAVFVFLVAAYAFPEKKIADLKTLYGRVRIVFLFDVSKSMIRAEDLKPNRLVVAKEFVAGLVEMLSRDPELRGAYPLALIPFAGAAQPFFAPFTRSSTEFTANLKSMNEDTINIPGTSLWTAFAAYKELIRAYPPEDQNTLDIAVLISDGGKEEGRGGERKELFEMIANIQSGSDVSTSEGAGASRRVIVSTIGVGSLVEKEVSPGQKAFVPGAEPLIIRDKAGNFVDYERQDPANPQSPILKSELDEAILKEVAARGKGTYRHILEKEKSAQEFKGIVVKNRKKVGEIPGAVDYKPVFQWFLVPAFIMFYFLSGLGSWTFKLWRRENI